MKTKLIILLIGILSVGLVYGGIFSSDKTIPRDTFTEEEISHLKAKGIDTWSYNDTSDGNKFTRDLISNSDYNLPEVEVPEFYTNCTEYNITNDSWFEDSFIEEYNETSMTFDKTPNGTIYHETLLQGECLTYERIDYTSQEIQDSLDAKQNEKMKQIARAIRIRNETNTSTNTGEGDVVIGNK